MNFLNLRQGKNEQGQTFAVALGDRKLTGETLHYNGGIKCRTKMKA